MLSGQSQNLSKNSTESKMGCFDDKIKIPLISIGWFSGRPLYIHDR
mgnify:CR=1 FL=1|jgi:hypothetical protein